MKKLIFPLVILLASCTQIETQAEQKTSEYWMITERVSEFLDRKENKEAICYVIYSTGISCFKK